MGECYIPREGYQQDPPYKLHRIVSIFICTPLCTIGIIFNIICVVLWNRLMERAKKRNTSCGVYLIVIAIADIGTVTTFLTCDILLHLRPELIHVHSYNVFYAYVGYPAQTMFMFASFWLIAGVDTCRLTMVFFPVKFRQSAKRLTNTAIVLIIAFVIGVNFPNFFVFRASYTEEGVPCRYKTTFYLSESFANYAFWVKCMFMTISPWTIIVLVNVIIQIFQCLLPDYIPTAKRTAVEMGRLLCAISVWFVTLVFMQCVAQCFYLQTTVQSKHWHRVDSLLAFANLGQVLNSSCKPFLYLLASKTFRREFVRLFSNTKSLYSNITRHPNRHFNKSIRNDCSTGKKTTRRRWFGRSVNSIEDFSNFTAQVKYIAPSINSATFNSTSRENNNLFLATQDVTKIQLDP